MEKILTTLSTYPGKKITKVFETIYAFDPDLRVFRTLWDSEHQIKDAMNNLYAKAIKLGANPVLGVQISHLDQNIPFVMGTPVILEDE